MKQFGARYRYQTVCGELRETFLRFEAPSMAAAKRTAKAREGQREEQRWLIEVYPVP